MAETEQRQDGFVPVDAPGAKGDSGLAEVGNGEQTHAQERQPRAWLRGRGGYPTEGVPKGEAKRQRKDEGRPPEFGQAVAQPVGEQRGGNEEKQRPKGCAGSG